MNSNATNIPPATTARKATTRVTTRAGRDTGHHLVPAQRAPRDCAQLVSSPWVSHALILPAGRSDEPAPRRARMRNSQAGCPLTPLIVALELRTRNTWTPE